ncbi:MAG TPA: sulfatase-like hydrolase/transferase [Polyangia bacterium]
MRRGVDARSIALAGLAAGAAVGLADGCQAGISVGAGAGATVVSGVLCAAVDALVGLGLALAVVLVIFLTRWGWRVAPRRRTRTLAWAILGALAALGTGATVGATGSRDDRVLAGTAVALVAAALGLVGALLAPALARVLAPLVPKNFPRRRAPTNSLPLDEAPREPAASPTIATSEPPPPEALVAPVRTLTAPGLLLLAPTALVVGAALVYALVATTSTPLSEAARITRAIVAGLVAALLPAGLSLAAATPLRARASLSAALGGLLLVVVAVAFVRATWASNLVRLPWRDLRIPIFIGFAAAALAPVLAWRRIGAAKALGILLLAPPLALLITFSAAASEGARVATQRAAGLVAPALARVRPALDFDRDGFAGLLGGGDCNDDNANVYPRAQDWPEDGIDQDCDGRDVRAADLRPPPHHPVPASVPPGINVLLIVVDNLRPDHLGLYGYDRATSPALDQLALEGAIFDDAWAHAATTSLAMPALFTGRWPSAIKWDRFVSGPAIARGQRTLAEAMQAAGYLTGAFFAHSHYNRGNARGFERGVHQYDDRLAARHIVSAGDSVSGDLPAQASRPTTGTSAREMADDGIDFLRAYRDQKFFLTLHFHDPYPHFEPHGNGDGERAADLYDGEIRFTDRQIGRVVRALRELGIYEQTAILVTGDPAGLGAGTARARSALRFATRVPLVVRVPGLGPRRVRAPVGHVDIAPTLMNLARARQELSFVGRSFVDLMAGKAGEGAPATVVLQDSTASPTRPPASTSPRALVSASHHLIADPVQGLAPACYDRAADPGFARNLWGLPAGKPACAALKQVFDLRLALLRLTELPVDFAQRIEAGVLPPGARASAPAVARAARFSDAVRLIGYDVAIVGSPFPSLGLPPNAPPAGALGPGQTAIVHIARGGRVEVTTHFEVTGDLSGWRTFFHLDGPAGTWRNLDHVPVSGAYPVDRWRAGQTIRDRFTVEFGANEAPGLHTLALGFWHPPAATRQRLPVAPTEAQDGQNRLFLVSFLVE